MVNTWMYEALCDSDFFLFLVYMHSCWSYASYSHGHYIQQKAFLLTLNEAQSCLKYFLGLRLFVMSCPPDASISLQLHVARWFNSSGGNGVLLEPVRGDFAEAEIKLVNLLADSKMRRSVPLFAICLLNMKLAAGWFSLSISS